MAGSSRDYYQFSEPGGKGVEGELDFPEKQLIYSGPSGYSDLAALSNGDLLLFENGAIEYDQRLTLVRVTP